MKPPVLFDRVVSATEKSVIGVDVTVQGTLAYNTGGYFNNSVEFTTNRSNRLNYKTNVMASMNAYTIEYWFNPNYNMVAGVPSDGTDHNAISLQNVIGSPTGSDWCFISEANSNWRFYRTGSSYYMSPSPLNWTAGTWYHIAYVLDYNKIDATDYIQIYLDGIKKMSYTSAINSVPLVVNSFVLGAENDVVSVALLGINRNVCNLKMYDYAKTDFSDRFNERGGLNDQALII